MNFFKRMSFVLGLCLISFHPLFLNAQTPAASPGGATTPMAGVVHMGNYIQENGGADLMVYVQDGITPLLWWRDGASGTTGAFPLLSATAQNPDVAVSRMPGTKVATIIYEVSGAIYYEMHTFSAGVWTPQVFPTLVSAGGTAQNPNTDGGFYGIFTWEEVVGGVSQILTRDVHPLSGIMGPISNITAAAGHSGVDCHSPDVAAYSGPSTAVYHYTYIVDYGVSQEVHHQLETASSINAGTPLGSTDVTVQMIMTVDGQFADPRIATQNPLTGAPEPDAAAITYLFFINFVNEYHIMTYTQPAGITDLTGTGTFYNCQNKNPKITWTNCGEYVVIWDHDGAVCGGSSIGVDVLSRKTDAMGIPSSGYQWVNNPTAMDQFSGAVSGRFALGAGIFTNYIDPNAASVMTKYTNCAGTPFMREAAMESEISQYYDPALNILTIEGEALKSISIYTINGQLVQSGSLNNESIQHVSVDNLPSGIYLLNIMSSEGLSQSKLIIQ